MALIFASSSCQLQANLVFLDNFSESGGPGYVMRSTFLGQPSTAVAQQFNTGGKDYRLKSIETIIFRDTANADFTARIWTTGINGQPDTPIANMTLTNNPAGGQFATYEFQPTTKFFLNGQTDYFFSVESNLGSNVFLSGSVQGSNNYSGPGNILEAVYRSQDSGQTWPTFSTNAALLRVTAVPEPSSLLLLGCTGLVGLRRKKSG